MTSVDDFGRVLTTKLSNDVHRDDDDLCIDVGYATPIGSNERVLSAVSSRKVSDCAGTVYAKDTFAYDQLAVGSIGAGHLTSHGVEQRGDVGQLLSTIDEFDSTYNASGNLETVTTTREGGASRTATVHYDPFELAITDLTLAASGLPTTTVTIERHPLTLNALSTTDANQTKRGAAFDGFDRQTMSTITPPGGTEGVLSLVRFDGFSGTDTQRSIFQKVFQTAVAIGDAPSAAGRTSTVFLDELGRAYKTQVDLGASYPDPTLISRRTFDSLGRVVFEADPFPSSQAFATAYGSTQFFNADGSLLCSVRGNGQQSSIPGTVDQDGVVQPATDESHELYPTCIQRTFQNNTRVVTVRDASSYLSGSPQQGVAKASYSTAAGRVIARSTWQGSTKLEHATLAYDKLGRLTGMTRYQDPGSVAQPVTSSWHYDSLGQLLELDEPDSSPRTYTYSKWGELLTSSRFALPSSSDDPPNGPVGGPPGLPPNDPIALSVVAQYDALGRVIHKEEQRDGVTDPQTINDYFYDTGVNITTQVTPTYTRGRLTQASWPTGSVSYSYDAAGDINAQVFLDPQGRTYVEKRNFNDDGTLNTLDMFLPDAAGGQMEEAVYGYDSAGHGNSVIYKTGDHLQNSLTLDSASQIDPFGRVRAATYGLTSYAADYADVGRRLINQVTASSMAGSRQISFQGFDPMERERSRTETKNSTDSNTTTYVYDALGRLSSSVRTGGTASPFNQQFTYDPLGNVLGQRDTSGATDAVNATLTYLGDDHDRDRICRISYGSDSGTVCNVTYDEVGSITSMATPNGTRQFDYLVDGSIRSIQDDHARADFRYDAFGEVQEIDVTMGAAPFVPDARRDRHHGDLFTWHDETTASHTVPVLLRKIPGPDGFLATRHGAGGPWVFSFGEERGTRFLTDDGGAFVQDVNYQPFGKPTSTGTSSLPGSSLYSNEQWNQGDYLAAFGISQLGARLYDPAIGRFLSRDRLLIPRTSATTNPYAFASNDPVNHSDPSGLAEDGRPGQPCEFEGVTCEDISNAGSGSSEVGELHGGTRPGDSDEIGELHGGTRPGDSDEVGELHGGTRPGSSQPPDENPPSTCPTCGWDHGRPGGGGRDGSGGGGGGGGRPVNDTSGQAPGARGRPSLEFGWNFLDEYSKIVNATESTEPEVLLNPLSRYGAAAWLAACTAYLGGPLAARAIAAFGTAAPAVPSFAVLVQQGIARLTGTNGGQMLGQAVRYLQELPGGIRASVFPKLAEYITTATNGQWSASLVRATNAIMFVGEGGEALVFDRVGNMFRGSLNDRTAFPFGDAGDIQVVFEALRKL